MHLRNKRLVGLPAEIGGLAELRLIDLRGNPLTSLPRTMLEMTRLEKLDLRWVRTLAWPGWLEELEGRGCLVYR